jgi:hypothetical protein
MDKRTGKKKKQKTIKPETHEVGVPAQKVPVVVPKNQNTTHKKV